MPWENAYRATHLLGGRSRFVLSTSGHIQALVNPPAPDSRSSYRVARMRNQPGRAVDELRFALAGPAVTAVIALAFGLLAWRLSPAAPAGLRAFVDYQLQVNTAIVIFNLRKPGKLVRAVMGEPVGSLVTA